MITENYFAPIAALDLDPIKVKLMHEESGEGWSRAYADAIEFEYRRFLYLVKKFPDEQAAPLFDVDVFWHYHILDTMKYAMDCEQIFGYFLHHFPYVGLRGEDDEKVHHRVGVRMQELYEATFGQAYVRMEEHHVVTAKAAWSMSVAQNDSSYSARPALELSQTAWSMSAPQNDSSYSVRPALESLKTAWSMSAPQNDSPSLVRTMLKTAKSAWSMSAPQGDKFNSVRPQLGTPKTAWSMSIAQNDPSYSVRPALANAA